MVNDDFTTPIQLGIPKKSCLYSNTAAYSVQKTIGVEQSYKARSPTELLFRLYADICMYVVRQYSSAGDLLLSLALSIYILFFHPARW